MKDGFIKTATATPKVFVADCGRNTQGIIEQMKQAAEMGVRLLCFPELCITGYTCGDLFLQPTLLEGAVHSLGEIVKASKGLNLLAAVGLPLKKGGKLYNCAVFFCNGEILGVVPKTHIPNYGEFYEARNFTSAPAAGGTISLLGKEVPFSTKLLFACSEIPEIVVGCEICEDVWVASPPSGALAAAGATVIFNLSASDEFIGKAQYRRTIVTAQSARLLCAYVYADAGEGESTTDLVFSGHSLIAENGVVLAESKLFENTITATEIDVKLLDYERRRISSFEAEDTGYTTIGFSLCECETPLTRFVLKHPFVPQSNSERAQRCESILEIQSRGLKTRLCAAHAKTAVIGISGGLDSCLALLVSVRAFDLLGRSRSEIVAVTMPCFGTTERTHSNAIKLCDALGVTLREVDITKAVEQHFADIGHDPENKDVTFENSQARERTQVLMDIANETGGFVVGTGDLSELALGWATYNGDHMSMYGVNASVPKTLVRHLVGYEADKAGESGLRSTLLDILNTPVSPELLPAENGEIAQKTEDIVGPYELHDFFLYNAVRRAFTPAKIFRLAKYAFCGEYSDETLKKWLKNFYRRFFAQQFKRSCLPDGPKVGTLTLSPRGDWRMPSDASSALWLEEAEKL